LIRDHRFRIEKPPVDAAAQVRADKPFKTGSNGCRLCAWWKEIAESRVTVPLPVHGRADERIE
jgi:hypothetical protein